MKKKVTIALLLSLLAIAFTTITAFAGGYVGTSTIKVANGMITGSGYTSYVGSIPHIMQTRCDLISVGYGTAQYGPLNSTYDTQVPVYSTVKLSAYYHKGETFKTSCYHYVDVVGNGNGYFWFTDSNSIVIP